MRYVLIIAGGLLAGCAGPRALCERDVAAEVRIVETQIAESRRALATGYREELRRPRLDVGVPVCEGRGARAAGCADLNRPPQRARVTIDPAEEQRVLTGLQNRRIELLARADRDVAQCVAAQ